MQLFLALAIPTLILSKRSGISGLFYIHNVLCLLCSSVKGQNVNLLTIIFLNIFLLYFMKACILKTSLYFKDVFLDAVFHFKTHKPIRVFVVASR